MSADHEEHESDGAHEIDKMPYARLFNLLVGLSALTLLSCIGVIQIFNLQVRQIVEDYAAEGQKDSALTDYRGEAAQVAAGYGRFEFELEGKTEERFYVPLTAAKKQVLEDPKLLDGPGSYRGWEDSPVGKQIKDWGGLPTPKPAEPRKRPGPEGAPVDGKAPAPEEGKAEEGKAEEGEAKEEGKAEAKEEGKAEAKEEGKAEAKEEGKGEGKQEKGGEERKGRGERKGKSGTGTGTGTARPSAGEAKADG
jgi:hypothetical protein